MNSMLNSNLKFGNRKSHGEESADPVLIALESRKFEKNDDLAARRFVISLSFISPLSRCRSDDNRLPARVRRMYIGNSGE